MNSSSFEISSSTVLVADASVVINLNATGRAIDIIKAQPGSVTVTEHTFAEIERGVPRGHRDAEKLKVLIGCGAVQLVRLGEAGNHIYESLVVGITLDTLDDGEATTIGYAHEIGGVALIDERKAQNICKNRFPNLVVASTIDLLLHEKVRSALGQQGQIDAIVNALHDARMRVPPHQVSMVVGMIGRKLRRLVAVCRKSPDDEKITTPSYNY